MNAVAASRMAVPAILLAAFLGAAQAAGTLTLGEAMQRALERNPALKSHELEVEKQELEKEVARGQRLPRVDLNAGYTRHAYPTLVTPIREAGTFPALDRNIASIGVALSMPLYTGGRLVAGESLAQHNRDAAAHALRSAGQDLLFNVTATYTKALHLRDLQKAAQARIRALEAEEAYLVRRLAEGRAAKLELTRLQTQLSQARHDLLAIEQGERDALTLLAALLGESGRLPQLSDLTPISTVPAASAEEALARARRQHPELLRARSLEKAASANVDIAKGEQRPQLSLVASAQESAAAGDWDAYSSGQLGVQLAVPLFDGSIRKNRVAQARLERRKSELLVAQAADQVSSEVLQAAGAVDESRARLGVAAQGEREADEALAIETLRYQQGESTVTDLLGAEAALWSARVNRLQASYDAVASDARLLRATGELSPASFTSQGVSR